MRIEQKSGNTQVEVNEVGAGLVVDFNGLKCIVTDKDEGDGNIWLVDLNDGEAFDVDGSTEVVVYNEAQLTL